LWIRETCLQVLESGWKLLSQLGSNFIETVEFCGDDAHHTVSRGRLFYCFVAVILQAITNHIIVRSVLVVPMKYSGEKD
jgi:hypothetical protein